MQPLVSRDLWQWIEENRASFAPPVGNKVIWEDSQFTAMVIHGPNRRRDFHDDPSDEIFYQLKGAMTLEYIDAQGRRQNVVIREGEIIYCPAGTPHSPRFSPDSFVLVLERQRRPGEQDRFVWFCERCNAKLYEVSKHVSDYREDPVSRAYEEFYASEAHRTCANCGYVMPRPGA